MKKVATLLLTTILQAQPNTIWIRTFGGINSDYGRSIQQVFNDGYIIIGTTASFDDNNDVWLIKTDVQGNKWMTTCLLSRFNPFTDGLFNGSFRLVF